MYINGLVSHGQVVYGSGGGLHAYDPVEETYIGSRATTNRYLGITSHADRLYAVCADGLVDMTDVSCGVDPKVDSIRATNADLPGATLALAAAPNPFNPQTQFSFTLEHEQSIELAVFDLKGRRVRELARGNWTANQYTIEWNGCDDQGRGLSSGVYFARLQAGPESAVTRVVLVK